MIRKSYIMVFICFLIILILNVSCNYSSEKSFNHEQLVILTLIMATQDENFKATGHYSEDTIYIKDEIYGGRNQPLKYCYMLKEDYVFPDNCPIYLFPTFKAYMKKDSFASISYDPKYAQGFILLLDSSGMVKSLKISYDVKTLFNLRKEIKEGMDIKL